MLTIFVSFFIFAFVFTNNRVLATGCMVIPGECNDVCDEFGCNTVCGWTTGDCGGIDNGGCGPGYHSVPAGGCRPNGSGGSSGGGGPAGACYGTTANCPPGATISLQQPIGAPVCSSSWGGGFCGPIGTAQRTTGCCVNYHNEDGTPVCDNPQIQTYTCCGAGSSTQCNVTGSYTRTNSYWAQNICSNPNDVFVSAVQDPALGVAGQECVDYKPNGDCRVGGYRDLYNVRATCNQVTCTCGVICPTVTPPIGVTVSDGASLGTSVNVGWTVGTGGGSQYFWMDESSTEVSSGCPTSGACNAKLQLSSSDNSETVIGLNPSTTYYFQIVTVTTGGATCSSQSYFGNYTTPANNTLSGVVYLDNSNNCTGTAWNAGSLGSLTVAARGTAYSGSVGNDGRFSFATGTTSVIPYLDLSTPPAGYTCSTGVGCNNNCTLSNLTSPSSTNYFYISPSREAWWQAVGGSIYANGSVRSEIPSASLSLIAPGVGNALGALMRSSGTVDTGAGTVSSEGYSAQTTYKGKTMNYDFFAAHMGVTGSTPNDWGADTMNKPANNPTRDFYYINPSGSEASVTTPWNIASGESYVVFVNGDLRIASNVTVAPGGFVAFIVNGNLAVSPAVTSMQGLYVIDSTFASETNSGTDVALGVEGSVVAWGGVSLGRDLVNTNSTIPGETFKYRPDLITNMPEKMKVFALKWEEVVPGTFE